MRGKCPAAARLRDSAKHFALISQRAGPLTASVYALRAAFGGCAPTRACGRSPSGEGIFYWFSPAATTAASAMELTFVWKESLRLVRMAGTLVPVRMQPFLQSAVWTSVL